MALAAKDSTGLRALTTVGWFFPLPWLGYDVGNVALAACHLAFYPFLYHFYADFSLLPTAPFTGLVVLLGFPTVSTLGCLLSGSDIDPCGYQPEDEASSGDHKGEMHAREERLLIAHQCSQDRNS